MIHQCQTIADLINENSKILEAEVVNDFPSRDTIRHSPVFAKTDRHIFTLIAYIGIMLQKLSRFNDGEAVALAASMQKSKHGRR